MAIKLGTSDISKVYLGANEVSKIYLGATEIYSSAADYGTYVNAMITRANALSYTLPSSATLTDLQNRLATIGATALNKLDVLHIYSPDAGTMDFFTLNVVAPTTNQATLVNSPTSSKLGITTDGSTNYIDSGFDPYNDSANFTLNDNHYGFIASQSTIGILGGQRDNTGTDAGLLIGGNGASFFANNDLGGGISSNYTAGYKVNQRISSSEFKMYSDGTEINSFSTSSIRIPNAGNIYLGGWNVDGAISSRSVNRYAGFTVGASLTTTEMSTISTQITAFYGR
jgi:hypothetical protein